MNWLTALLAAIVQGLLAFLTAARKEAAETAAKVDQGRAEVANEVKTIVVEAADAQAQNNQRVRDPRSIAERLLAEAGEPGSGGDRGGSVTPQAKDRST